MSGSLLWHYTVGHHLPDIFAAGVLKAATAGIAVGERPAVWFSTHPAWEQTACKSWRNRNGRLIPLGRDDTHRMGGGLRRVGVAAAAAPYCWGDFRRMSGIPDRQARALDRVAREKGANPNHWFVTFDPVPRSAWLAVEAWDAVRREWFPIDPRRWQAETPDAPEANSREELDPRRRRTAESMFDTDGVSLNRSTDPRPVLAAVDVVMGVDVMSEEEFLVYGRTLLKRVAAKQFTKPVSVLHVTLDADSDELDRFCDLVAAVRGADDARQPVA